MKIHSVLFVITAILGFLGLGCAGSQVNVQSAPQLKRRVLSNYYMKAA